MKKKIIKSYAKINLSLNVIGKDRNNFHKIQSIISFLDLHDIIYIKQKNKKKHIVKFSGIFSKNIRKDSITQLLKILDQKKLLNKKFSIQVIKNIPQESGLGGGSMNAASVLKFLLKNKLIKLSKNEILNISNRVGSDVFLGLDRKNLILVNNKKIKKFSLKLGLFLILIKPKIGCSTKEIYGHVKKYSKKKIKVSKKVFKIKELKKAHNYLEKPAFTIYPILRKLKIFLTNIDEVEFVRMTGSGSTMVAYFSNRKSAINGLNIVKKNFKNYWSILSKTI